MRCPDTLVQHLQILLLSASGIVVWLVEDRGYGYDVESMVQMTHFQPSPLLKPQALRATRF